VCRIGILLIVILLTTISALPGIIATVDAAEKTNTGMVTDALRNGTSEKERQVRTNPTEIIIHLDNRCKLVHAMMLRTTSNKFC